MEKPGVSAFIVRFNAQGLARVKYRSFVYVPRSIWISLSSFTIIKGPIITIIVIFNYYLDKNNKKKKDLNFDNSVK